MPDRLSSGNIRVLGLSAHCAHDEVALALAIADRCCRQTDVAKVVNAAAAAVVSRPQQAGRAHSHHYYCCDAVSPSAETGT